MKAVAMYDEEKLRELEPDGSGLLAEVGGELLGGAAEFMLEVQGLWMFLVVALLLLGFFWLVRSAVTGIFGGS